MAEERFLVFTRWAIEDLPVRSNPLVRPTSPFSDLPRRRDVIWLEPRLSVEVTYAEVMRGRLRDPVFRELRGLSP